MRGRLMRYAVYFRRGHTVYLALAVSILNFITIQYRLLVQYVPPLQTLFTGLLEFAATAVAGYLVAATLIGWLDYRRGTVLHENILLAQASPYVRDFAKALAIIADQVITDAEKKEEVRRMLEKWAPRDQ